MFDPNQYVPIDTFPPQLKFIFYILLIWSVAWKLVSLWKSARHGQKIWFAVLFLINSVGILDLIYLFFFQRNDSFITDILKKRFVSRKKTSK